MALSPQDRAFYEEKLNWKSFFYLLASTVGIGAIVWPLMLFVQDWYAGLAADWTVQRVIDLSFDGFTFGLVVSAIMYLLFRFFLWMGWLPSRR